MQKKIFFSSIIVTIAGFSVSSAQAEVNPKDPKHVEAVENIVRDYLQKKPEIIEEALTNLHEKRQLEEQQKVKAAIKKHYRQIFDEKKDPYMGDPKSQATVAVFMDPYCGYCRHFQKVIAEVLKEKPNLKIIYKTYPILGEQSKLAAQEELAANAFGQFQEYHDLLYSSEAESRSQRLEDAKKNKINVKEIAANLPGDGDTKVAKEVAEQLNSNIKLGKTLGITGTPSLIIGETFIPGMVSKEQFIKLLGAERP